MLGIEEELFWGDERPGVCGVPKWKGGRPRKFGPVARDQIIRPPTARVICTDEFGPLTELRALLDVLE